MKSSPEDKNTQHHRWSFLLSGPLSEFAWGRLSRKAKKMTQNTWEEVKRWEIPEGCMLINIWKKSRDKPCEAPCRSALWPENKQVHAWESSGKERGFEGWGHTCTYTHSNIPRWDTPKREDDCVRGRRRSVLEVKRWLAGRFLAHRAQRAGRSPWWHAWCARRAWSPQSP